MSVQILVTRKFVSGGGYTQLDISDLVEQATWSGSKYNAPRSLEVSLTNAGSTKFTPTDEDYLFLKVDGKELFRGKVFSYGWSTGKKVTIKAYDSLIYLTKNKDSKIYINRTATQIIKSLCNDFQIGIGSIANTSKALSKQVYQNATIYDMMMKALDVTRKSTGNKYYIFSNYGKISVVKRTTLSKMWVIDEDTNLIDYSRDVSMENMSTRVKLQTEFEKESTKKDGSGDPIKTTLTSIKTDSGLAKKFGILQYYEKLSEELTQAQLNSRADQALKDNSKIEKTFSINAIGIPDVYSGGMVQVILSELGIKKNYYIDQDTHTFSAGKHMMSLTLTETDEAPEIVIEDYKEETSTTKKKDDKKEKDKAKKKEKEKDDLTEWEEAGEEWRDRWGD